MADVQLYQKPDSAINVVTFACKQCTEWEPIFEYNNERLVQRVIRSGHMSVLEHISYTFRITCSRACTHQLVRHRLASYSQYSQRYAVDKPKEPVYPKTLEGNPEVKELVEKSHNLYNKLVTDGVPMEDARYILPEGTSTAIVVTMNGRELFHFFSQRLCKRAQWEIREIASKMLQICRKDCPAIFSLAGPKCEVNGACNEAKSCGHYMMLTMKQSSGTNVEA